MPPIKPSQDNGLHAAPYTETSAALNGLVPAYRTGGLTVDAAPPSVLTSGPTPWALLAALRRRWLLAFLLGVLAAGVGAFAAWYMSPISWRARTMLHISSLQPFILFQNPEGRIDFANYQRSQLALVKSRLVLNAALRDPEVAQLPDVQNRINPVEWLHKKIEVDFSQGPEILTIAMSGEEPDPLNKFVAAVRKAYITEIVNKEANERDRRLTKLTEVFRQKDLQLTELKKTLRKTAEFMGSMKSKGLQYKQQSLYSSMDELEKELRQLQSQTQKLQLEIDFAVRKQKELTEKQLPPQTMEEQLKRHPEITKLQALILETQKRVDGLKANLRNPEKDTTFIAESSALAESIKELDSRRASLRPELEKHMREESSAQTTIAIIHKKDELLLLKQLEQALQAGIDKKNEDIKALGSGSVDLDYLDAEIAALSEVHKYVLGQKQALEIEKEAPSRVSVLEDPYAIQTRDQSGRMRTAGMASFGLFGLAVLGVALLEFRARRVSGVGEVVYGLGFRLFGVLPRVPTRALGSGAGKRSDEYWQHLLTESIDATRTMLVHAAKQESLRVVMVTSALKGEGKTLLSSHLAVSMARAGFKTLLIDADLRRPSIYRLLDVPFGPGLSELLRGHADLDAVLRSGPLPGLTVLTAGHWDTASVRLLAQQRLAEVLEGLKKQFDLIMIDSAPILPAADSLLIGQHVDGVLFSVLRDVSRLPTVYAAYERMAMLGVRILGAVVGGAALDGYSYRYEAPPADAN